VLAQAAEIRDILVCPRCRGELSGEIEELRCASQRCGLSADDFPDVGLQPALIDFDASVIDRAGLIESLGSSYSNRKQRVLSRVLRQLAFGRNRVAEKYVVQMLNDLGSMNPAPRLLIIGGGGIGDGAAALYEDDQVRVIGTDIYRSTHTTVVADGHHLPFADGSVDGVWIQAVLEHVLDPQQVVAEIHRVLRKDGLVFANTPFMQQVHEGAYDFTRFTLSGHRWLFRNFTLLEAGTSAGAGVATVWSLRYLVRAVTGSPKLGMLAAAACWWLRLIDNFFDNRNAADAASGVYFYGRKSGVSISPKDVIAFYHAS
jgi:ubiquinone/menaquinone biosynthesis C-methylase UbiE